MKWKVPPRIKIYEALGAVADSRLKLDGNNATIRSSSGNKTYAVTFEPETNSITSNDNGSYYQGYLGYPMIAFLMAIKALPYDSKIASWLEGLAWKDINTKHHNDFVKTENCIRNTIIERGGSLDELDSFLLETTVAIKKLSLNKLKSSAKPPVGY